MIRLFIRRTLVAILLAGTLLASAGTALAEPFTAEDEDISVAVYDFWEHKVTLLVLWGGSPSCNAPPQQGWFSGPSCPLKGTYLHDGHLADVTSDRVDDKAEEVCAYYERDAVGPVSFSRPDISPSRFALTYACAIR